MVLITVGAAIFTFFSVRALRKRVLPLLAKMDGMMDNLAAIAIAARDQVDELKTVMDDLGYSARKMAKDMQTRVMPPIMDTITAFSGIARFLAAIFGWGKKM
jgi:hypothetical protein